MTTNSPGGRSAPPFVGRERELAAITGHLKAPRSGGIHILLIAGEPGVGKTRLMQEAVTVAQGLNWLTLVGHAYDTEGMPPYLPFIEALQQYASASQPGELEAILADAGPEVALLVPGLVRAHGETPSRRSDPETQRYLLFETVCECLQKAAASGSRSAGLLLCLDDLHWADESTLLLLEHLTRKRTSAPIVIIATYRDTELDASRPLARTLEQLTRQGVASRTDLKRLNREGLAALLAALGGSMPPSTLVDTVFNETEGNPFFVREVFENLREAGRLMDASGAWLKDVQVAETDVPQGVRLIISRRLERLSDDCAQVLALAAVLGRSFSYELLGALAEVDEDALLRVVEEVEHANLLSSDANGRVTFTHELIRQTLLANLSSLRRQRLHLSAGLAIERLYADRLDLHSSDLAIHFMEAGGQTTNLAKGVHYAELAAQRAVAVYAYAEAVRVLDRALEAQESLDPDDRLRHCDLLLALIYALRAADENQRVVAEVAPLAFSLAEALTDRTRMGAIAFAALTSSARLWSGAVAVGASGTVWLQRADEYTDPETAERAMVDARKAGWLPPSPGAQRSELAADAYRLAKRLSAREAQFEAAGIGFLNNTGPLGLIPDALEVLQEMMNEPRDRVSSRSLGLFLSFGGLYFLFCGDRESSDKMFAELGTLADRMNDSHSKARAVLGELIKAAVDGKFPEALDLVHSEALTSPTNRLLAALATARIDIWLGRFEAARAAVEPVPGFWSSPVLPAHFQAASIAVLAAVGMTGEARERLTAWVALLQPGPETAVRVLAETLEAAVMLEEIDLTRELSGLLEGGAYLSAGGPYSLASPGRLLGDAAILLGDFAKARSFYEIGLRAAGKIHFRPEIALIRLSLAELMLRHYPTERPAALEHLDFAIGEFQEMKMAPALERAMRVGRRRPPGRPPASQTNSDSLSEREMEVLRLIAAGQSNREIAECLTLSIRTVARHITNIYGKIGTRSKAEATAYAIHRGLN